MHRLLRKIFQSRQNNQQTLFAGFGLMVGLVLLLWSLQVYFQIQALLNSQDKYSEYLVLSKKVSLNNAFFLSRATFSEKEIRRLKQQAFVDDVGAFISNQYQVMAFASESLPFRTELFFESVPDKFLDVKPQDWRWNESSKFIPVVISRDMLNLYNFGYALAKGLPQLPASAVKGFPVKARVRGPQGQRTFDARIVGFTERISSVLVPESFMTWANQNIGENQSVAPSRIIVKVNNTTDPRLAKYLDSNKYQINQDRLKASRAGAVVQIVMSVIGFVGLIFMALSFVVFSQNFRVIIAETKEEIRLLTQLGYTIQILARFLVTYFAIFIGVIVILASLLLYYAIITSQQFLRDQGLDIYSGISPSVIGIGLLFVGLILIINILSVIRLLKKYT